MVLNVYNEGDKDYAAKNLSISESDSSEIQRIKQHLDLSNLKYVSDVVQNLLGINVYNDSRCFDKNTITRRIIKEGDKYRVTLYLRLSVEDGDVIDGDVSRSIRNQLLLLLDECEKRDWIVVGIFCEEGISGANDNRPEWTKSLQFCECGNTEIVLCKSQSRFSRSMEMIEKYLHNEFVNWNIRFVGLVDSTDTSVVGNKKARQINGLVNEWQVEDQSINIRAILKNKQANGLFTGSFAPYGYMKDPKDKYHLIIDEDAAKVIRQIFSMYASGKGATNICTYLNKRKVPIPSIYKAQKGLKYHNSLIMPDKRINYQVEDGDTLVSIADKYQSTVEDITSYNHLTNNELEIGQKIVIPVRSVWRTTTIYNILKDETYIGTLIQHKNEVISYKNKKERKIPENERIKVPHCHSAIIDSETWNIVQSRFAKRSKARPTKEGDIALFSKKIVCDCCGHRFYRNVSKVKTGPISYWQCGNRYSTACYLCNNRKVLKEDDLYELVLSEINKQIKIYYDKTLVEKNYYAQKEAVSIDNEIKILDKELTEIADKISKKEAALALLYDDRANGIIDTNEFSIIKNKNSRDIDSFKARAKEIDNELKELKCRKTSQSNTEAIIKKYKTLDKLERNILDEFISNIYIGYYEPKTKTRKIRIGWNINAE